MKKANPLEQLQIRKAKLRAEIDTHENRIKERFKYLETHYPSMIIYSLLPLPAGQKDKLSSVFSKVSHMVTSVIPGDISEEKKSKYEGFLKVAQMTAAGLVYRYLRSVIK